MVRRPELRARLRASLELINEFRDGWSRARVGGLSAEIAFFAVLGLFPAMLLFAAALGSVEVIAGVDAEAAIKDWVVEQVSAVFGDDNTLAATVAEVFDRSNAGLITISVVLSAYTASRGLTAVVGALDVVYGHENRRNWVSTRLMGLVLTLITLPVAAVVAATVVVGPLLGTGEEFAERLGLGSWFVTLWNWFRWPWVFVLVVLWAAMIYHFAPLSRSRIRVHLPGAVVGTVWWLSVTIGFRSYLDIAAGGVNAVFGLLGGALSLIVWLYLMAMGLLVGAEANAILIARARRNGALASAG